MGRKREKEKENFTHPKELINEKIKLYSNNPDLLNININREKDEININNNDINYEDFFEKEKHFYMKNLYSNYQTKINSKEKDSGMYIDDITNPNIKRQIKKVKRGGYKHRRHSKNTMNFK